MKSPQGQLKIVLDISVSNQVIFQKYDEIGLNIKSLNFKQQQVFDFAFPLAKASVKQRSSKNPEVVKFLFICFCQVQ